MELVHCPVCGAGIASGTPGDHLREAHPFSCNEVRKQFDLYPGRSSHLTKEVYERVVAHLNCCEACVIALEHRLAQNAVLIRRHPRQGNPLPV